MSINLLVAKLSKELNLKSIELDEIIEKLRPMSNDISLPLEERCKYIEHMRAKFEELLPALEFINQNAAFAKGAHKNYVKFSQAYKRKCSQ